MLEEEGHLLISDVAEFAEVIGAEVTVGGEPK